MQNIGRKIVVVGVSASGKSTFARKLAERTGLPLIHTDSIMWRPGWHYIGDDETFAALEEATNSVEWVLEGFINKGAFATVLGRADTILYLDYPRYLPAWRYIKRWLRHRKDPRPELDGCPETFSFEFLVRVWKKKEVYRLNKFLKTMSSSKHVHYLRTPKEARALIDGIEQKEGGNENSSILN